MNFDLIEESGIGQNISVVKLPPRRAVTTSSFSVHERLMAKMASRGIEELYSHQAEALSLAQQGKDVVVVTGTNSGKSLCYQLPSLDAILREPAARALFLFPTKALAQDQCGKLSDLLPGPDVRVGTYDGDTPASQRPGLRKLAHILFSNPDMLHAGILPQHENWVTFLRNLRFICLDEMHVYRGIFGCHTANVLRRLLRLCEWHGNRPQIIACSATIANPTELFRKLTGREAALVDEDGSPQGARTYSFWTPPYVDETTFGSANMAVARIITNLVSQNLRVLAFCRSRVGVELVLKYTRDVIAETTQLSPKCVDSYRAGYTPKERREIEKALFTGRLRALAATNAMELGVDIGALDCVVMNGIPGTVSSFWQQSGRAGRGTRDGLAILVASDDPLEQWIVREPEILMNARVEAAAVNPENRFVLGSQLRCAAQERPIAVSEMARFGESALGVAEELEAVGELVQANGLFIYPSYESAAQTVSIRGSGSATVRLMHGLEEIGTMEWWRALQQAHAGAVYLQRGQSWYVESLDLELRVARMRPEQLPYYTQSIILSNTEAGAIVDQKSLGDHQLLLCGVEVNERVTGYRQKSIEAGAVLGVFDLDLPAQTFETVGVRFCFESQVSEDDPVRGLTALHSAEHALMAVSPLLGGCDRGDLGSNWQAVSTDTGKPTLFVYDRVPGGVGLAERLFEDAGSWARQARHLLQSCSCEKGCPACLMSSRCEISNELLDKALGLELLEQLR